MRVCFATSYPYNATYNPLSQGELHTGYGRFQPYAPGFKIIKQEDGKVAQLYHDGSDGKSYCLVYINLDLNVRRRWDADIESIF